MPSPRAVKQHGGIARIRTKRLSDGTILRIYFYKDGKSYGEAVKKRRKRGTSK
jgi:hypothetical protein